MLRFANRRQAGEMLAQKLLAYKNKPAVVLALPRGGVVLAAVIADKLNLLLGLVIVRKLGHPGNPEYAVGAIAEDSPPVTNRQEVDILGQSWLKNAVIDARRQISARRDIYTNGGFKQPSIKNKTAIIVDDGIATGLTMMAAVKYASLKKALNIIIAVAVASRESCDQLQEVAEVITLDDPDNFLGAVGAHYDDFTQVDNDEVVNLLAHNE